MSEGPISSTMWAVLKQKLHRDLGPNPMDEIICTTVQHTRNDDFPSSTNKRSGNTNIDLKWCEIKLHNHPQ